jgi:phosphoribosylformylglycinamidine cyclo-ligase
LKEKSNVNGVIIAGVKTTTNGDFEMTGSRILAYCSENSHEVDTVLSETAYLIGLSKTTRYRSDIDFIADTQTKLEQYFTVEKVYNSSPPELPDKRLNYVTSQLKSNYAERLTYKKVGVDVAEADAAIQQIKQVVGSDNIGPFAGVVTLSPTQHLVSSMDGVGSKTEFVVRHFQKMGRTPENAFESLGFDLVNHCVNDLLMTGCTQPLYFMDYFGCSKLKKEEVTGFVRGLKKACDQTKCQLVGGETAEMPSAYVTGAADLVGSITGIMDHLPEDPKLRLIDLKESNPETEFVLMGYSSSSPHTNGYTLLNKIYKKDSEFASKFGEYCCLPHRCYLNIVNLLLNDDKVDILAMCHITGGGWSGNLKRVLPVNWEVDCEYSYDDWPEVYKYVCERYVQDEMEMMNTFNCGIGLILIVTKDKQILLEEAGFKRVGKLIPN